MIVLRKDSPLLKDEVIDLIVLLDELKRTNETIRKD